MTENIMTDILMIPKHRIKPRVIRQYQAIPQVINKH